MQISENAVAAAGNGGSVRSDCDEEDPCGSSSDSKDTGSGSSSTSGQNSSDDDEDLQGVSLIELTHDWGGFGSSMGESSACDSASSSPREGRRARYRNIAQAIEAAECARRDRKSRQQAFGNKFQAATGFIMFSAANLRVFTSLHGFLHIVGYDMPMPCNWKQNTSGLDMFFFPLLAIDILFIVFQIACVYRDRYLAMLRKNLWRAGSYCRLLVLHFVCIVILGVLSGWQILRSMRQLLYPGYRDSFLVELNDPGMVNDIAFRMPLYSSHLTFLFELPFACRIVHVFFRDYIMICDYPECLAWIACFQLIVVAAVTFDYSISGFIRERHSSSSKGGFMTVHILYRASEVLARLLTVGATTVTAIRGHTPVIATVILADYFIGLTTLCCASGTLSVRSLFMSVPFFGVNLALFADGPNMAKTSRQVSAVFDITRIVELLGAMPVYYAEFAKARHMPGNANYEYRVASCLVLLVLCGAICAALRAGSVIKVASLHPAEGSQEEEHQGRALESGSIYDSRVVRDVDSSGFVDVLFSKGIGDQFQSLLEIICERDRLRLSRLQYVDKLGEGGFGRVIKVRDTRTISSAVYALKLQRRDRVAAAAVREAEFLHEITHPFVVRLVRVFRTEAFFAILLELCDRDLNRVILDCKAATGTAEGLPHAEAKHLAACMVLALEHLHQRGIIFRDLKPENVLTVPAPSSFSDEITGGRLLIAKLADFGLARHVESPAAAGEQGAASAAEKQVAIQEVTAGVGTPAFMSKETTESEFHAESSEQVLKLMAGRDWYALGCSLMLVLLGERGGRLIRSSHREVLLPPPAAEICSTLHQNAAHLGDGQALPLLLALTAESAAERAAAAELRASAFLGGAIAEAERVALVLDRVASAVAVGS